MFLNAALTVLRLNLKRGYAAGRTTAGITSKTVSDKTQQYTKERNKCYFLRNTAQQHNSLFPSDEFSENSMQSRTDLNPVHAIDSSTPQSAGRLSFLVYCVVYVEKAFSPIPIA